MARELLFTVESTRVCADMLPTDTVGLCTAYCSARMLR